MKNNWGNNFFRKYLFIGAFITLFFAVDGQPVDSLAIDEFRNLSLKDLMDVEVKIGTLTPSKLADIPVSLTRISSEEIQNSPVRSIFDLIEIYVPGAVYTEDERCPQIEIRGVSGALNNSYLLLLDGCNINMKTGIGAIFELLSRDLNDIDHIDIISGPGSVIYGMGATGGIISIVTKGQNNDSQTIKVGIQSNFNYRYQSAYAQLNFGGTKINGSFYASASHSDGQKNCHFYGMSDKGETNFMTGNNALKYVDLYGDYDNKPQIKVRLNLNLFQNLKYQFRYSDFSRRYLETDTSRFDHALGQTSELINNVLEWQLFEKDGLSLNTKIGYQSQNHKIATYQFEKPFENYIPGISESRNLYSENNLFAESILNFEIYKKVKMGVGFNYTYFFLSPSWGNSRSNFIFSLPGRMQYAIYDSSAISNLSSVDSFIVLSNTISSNQFSVFSEAQVNFNPYLNLLISGRLDKMEISKYAFSPRIALFSTYKSNTFKLIGQRALRFPTFQELYVQHLQKGEPVEPEITNSLEFIYNRQLFPCFDVAASVYVNSLNYISLTPEGIYDVTGRMKTTGADLRGKYRGDKFDFEVNYSYIKQLDLVLFNSIDSVGKGNLPPMGSNPMYNFPCHSLKFVGKYVFSPYWSFQANGRLSWGYGQKNYLDSFVKFTPAFNTEEQKNSVADYAEKIRSYGYGKTSFTSNITLNFMLPYFYKSTLSVFFSNIFKVNNIRYITQSRIVEQIRSNPFEFGLIEEPLWVGINFSMAF